MPFATCIVARSPHETLAAARRFACKRLRTLPQASVVSAKTASVAADVAPNPETAGNPRAPAQGAPASALSGLAARQSLRSGFLARGPGHRPLRAGWARTRGCRPWVPSNICGRSLDSPQPWREGGSIRAIPTASGPVPGLRSIRSSRAVRLLPSVVGATPFPPRRSGAESLRPRHRPFRLRTVAFGHPHDNDKSKSKSKSKVQPRLSRFAASRGFASPIREKGVCPVVPLSLRACKGSLRSGYAKR